MGAINILGCGHLHAYPTLAWGITRYGHPCAVCGNTSPGITLMFAGSRLRKAWKDAK